MNIRQGYARAVRFLESVGLDRRRQGALAIGLLWMVCALPSSTTRSFIWEEGTNAEIARRVLDHGEFLLPQVYGRPWAVKPSLLAWLIAGVGRITGQVDEFSAHLPSMLAALGIALMIYRFGLRYLSLPAAFCAALAFLFSPLVLQKLAIAEPDLVVTLLSFAAFLVWWSGAERGRVGLPRWLGAGLLLAILVMAKGPQPAAFLALGAGGWILVRRSWREMPGAALCLLLPAAAILAWAIAAYRPGEESEWRAYMHLTVMPAPLDYVVEQLRAALTALLQLLPMTLLLPFLLWPGQRPKDGADVPAVQQALALYAIPCCVVLLFWPGSAGRYAMPAAPALALLVGFAWDRPGPKLLAPARRLVVGTIGALVLFQLVLVWVVMPVYANRFGASRIDGRAIEAAMASAPAPAYAMWWPTNQLFYVHAPILFLDEAGMPGVAAPAWLLVTEGELAKFSKLRPDLKTAIKLKTLSGPGLMAVRVEP